MCIQIFGYMCKDVIRNFDQIKNTNTISKENQAVSKSSADYVEKIAK